MIFLKDVDTRLITFTIKNKDTSYTNVLTDFKISEDLYM